MIVKVFGHEVYPVYRIEEDGSPANIEIVLSQSDYTLVTQARAVHEAAQKLLKKRVEEAVARREMRQQKLYFYTGDDNL